MSVDNIPNENQQDRGILGGDLSFKVSLNFVGADNNPMRNK